MERRDNPLKIVRLTIIAFVSLIIGLSLIGDARSQVRYEYKVHPEGAPGPILIPCIVIDRFNFVCIESTGEIFVDVAGGFTRPYPAGASTLRWSSPSTAHEKVSESAAPALLGLVRERRRTPASAATDIILAHQKLASDGWVDRSYNKKGERCCDSGKDCFSLDPERVKPAPGGVNVTLDNGEVIFVPGNEILPSEDGKIWSCFWGERLRCLFMPYNGS